jgi:hypothetical protein
VLGTDVPERPGADRWGIANRPTEDVTTMLNQLHTIADIAADHRRTLHAEAAAERLARSAVAARPRRSRGHHGFGVLRLLGRRVTGRPRACAQEIAGLGT